MDENIYSAWKTLRNFLRKMEITNSLEAIWWYMWFTFPKIPSLKPPHLPADMNYHKSIINPDSHYLFVWELRMLAEEIILNGRDCTLMPQDSLKNCKNFHKAMNKLKYINDASTEATLKNAHVLDEMYRIEHQQFRYQGHYRDNIPFIRYFKIYSTDDINQILTVRLGANCQEIFTANLCLVGLFLNRPTMKYPIFLPDLSAEINKVIRFVTKMCTNNLSDLHETMRLTHKIDNTYAYQYNPLTATPLVLHERLGQKILICPSPFDLQARLLNGLYYDLYDDRKFQDDYDFCKKLGDSFGKYVGDLLKATLGKDCIFTEDDSEYNKNLNRCDWIIDQEKSCLFVECKTKRPVQESYVNITNLEPLTKQLDILADAVIQSYKSYYNYRNEIYRDPNYIYDSAKNSSICVVTLENWYLMGKQKQNFDQIVMKKLEEAGISRKAIEEAPYIVMSIEEFEEFSYYLSRYDGFELIKKYNQECPHNTVRSIKEFVDKDFANKYEYVFKDDMPKCFPDDMKNLVEKIWN